MAFFVYNKRKSYGIVKYSIKHFFSNYAVTKYPVENTASLIQKCKQKEIVVVTGAGISTPSGIPDFRTPGIGLYDNLSEYNLHNATDIFDLDFFCRNPQPFFKLAKHLYPGCYQPNYVHYFLKALSKRGKLLRIYTQNIDSLELLAGIPKQELVEAHGSFQTATCLKCRQKYDGEVIKADVMNDIIPYCKNDWCSGIVKPDIVFFGEDLPQQFFKYHDDLSKCSLMLILGTSLEVYPVAGLVHLLPPQIPRVLFNLDVVEPFDEENIKDVDSFYCGDLVTGLKKVVHVLKWKDQMNELLEKNEVIDNK